MKRYTIKGALALTRAARTVLGQALIRYAKQPLVRANLKAWLDHLNAGERCGLGAKRVLRRAESTRKAA